MKKNQIVGLLASFLFIFSFLSFFFLSSKGEESMENRESAIQVTESVEERGEEMDVFPVRVYFFASSTCPHCRAEQKFWDELKQELPFLEVKRFEISANSTDVVRRVFSKISRENDTGGSIPLTVIGSEAVLGFDSDDKMGEEFKDMIKECALNLCESQLDREIELTESFDVTKQNFLLRDFEKVLGSISNS